MSEQVEMTSEQLAQRLAETRKAARAELLKDLGFDSKEAALQAIGQIAPMQERIKALEGFEATATKHGATVKRMAEEALGLLPEKVQKAIKARSKDDPDAILDGIAFYRETAAEEKAKEDAKEEHAPPPAKVPATTSTAGAPPPPAGAEPTHYQKWQDTISRNGEMAGQLFYQANAKAIEASRPVTE